MASNPTDPTHVHSDDGLTAGSSWPRRGRQLEDLLQAVPDRSDLERLYQRNIPLTQILQLLAHQVESRQIDFLLRCDDPRAEIRRVLRSA